MDGAGQVSEVDWSDRAFYDDGEWVTWTEIDAHLRGQEREALYGRSDHPLIPIFEDLLELLRGDGYARALIDVEMRQLSDDIKLAK